MAKMTRAELRKLIREMVSPADMSGLIIDSYFWDDIHNDGGSRSQGGELTINFSFQGKPGLSVTKYIISYDIPAPSLCEDLAESISDFISEQFGSAEIVTGPQVSTALGPLLGEIMAEFKQSSQIYLRAAEESYGNYDDSF